MLCVGRVRELLFVWYNEEAERGRNHARVQHLTSEMVGGPGDEMSSWGAETNGLLIFSRTLLRSYGELLAEQSRRQFERGLDSHWHPDDSHDLQGRRVAFGGHQRIL